MLAEGALLIVAKAVLSHVAKEGVAMAAPSARIRSLVGREPQEVACQIALARALARFESGFPELEAGLFDEHFLRNRGAPLLARSLDGLVPATGRELASAWGSQLGLAADAPRVVELEPAAPAAFLDYWRQELRDRPEFRALFDSRALDAMLVSSDRGAAAAEQMADEVGRLRTDLGRLLLQARYPQLEDRVDWPSRVRVAAATQVVGREWVHDRLRVIESASRSGYVSIVAEAGLGKSALAAAIALRFGAPAFFFSRSEGRRRTARCLEHLCAELIARHGLPYDAVPDGAGESAGVLSMLLESVADPGAPAWLVIDAIDEADDAEDLPLPGYLPAGTFIVLAHRPGDYAPIAAPGVSVALEEIRITPEDPRQQDDLGRFVRDRLQTDEALQHAVERTSPSVDPGTVTAAIVRASEGSFMYAAYVLADLARADGQGLDVHRLPRGLAAYYRQMWREISRDEDRWEAVALPVIERLAVAREPVTVEWIADHVDRPPTEVQRRALQPWQRFLRVSHGRRWRILHQSFAEYLDDTREVDLDGAHVAVARFYLDRSDRWARHGHYASRHLAAHLIAGGLADELFTLVDTSDWRAAQYLHDPSGTAYAEDVGRAWDLAEVSDTAAVATGRPPPLLIREVLCAFLQAEHHTMAAGLAPELLARAVETGVWQAREALHVAGRIPDPGHQARAIAALGQAIPDTLIDQALELAGRIRGSHRRAIALAALASRLPDGRRVEVMGEVLDAAEASRRGPRRVAMLEASAPTLSGGLLERALDLTGRLTRERDRVDGLRALAPHLPERLVSGALDAAAQLRDGRCRADAVAVLAARLPASQSPRALRIVAEVTEPQARARAVAALATGSPDPPLDSLLDAAERTTDAGARAWALAALAPRLDGERHRHTLHAALEAARAASSDGARAWALTRLAPDLPPALIGTAVALGRGIDRPGARARALTALAGRSEDGPARTEAFSEALTAAAATTATNARVHALEAVLLELPGSLIPQALTVIGETPNAEARASLLARIADRLPEARRTAVLGEALRCAQVAATPEGHARVLAALAPRLTPALLRRAVEEAGRITDRAVRTAALGVLAPHLPAELVIEALAVASVDVSSDGRALAIAGLVAVLPEDQRPLAIEAVLAAAGPSHDPLTRVRALVRLAPHLDADRRDAALEAAGAAVADIAAPQARARAAATLLPVLRGGRRDPMIETALAAARSTNGNIPRARTLIAVAAEVPEPARDALLAEALAAIAEPLRLSPYEEATTLGESDPHYAAAQARAIRAAAPLLTPSLMLEALRTALGIAEDRARARAVAHVVVRLPSELIQPAWDALPAWEAEDSEARLAFARHLSDDHLAEILELAPPHVPGDDGPSARVIAALAPRLTPPLAMRALEIARSIGRAAARARAIVALLAAMDEGMHEALAGEALDAIETVPDMEARRWLLVELAPRLSPPLARRAYTAALGIGEWSEQARALVGIAPTLAEEDRRRALAEALGGVRAVLADRGPAAELAAELAPGLDDLDPATLHGLWTELLHAAAQIGGQDLAQAVGVLRPLAERLCGPRQG